MRSSAVRSMGGLAFLALVAAVGVGETALARRSAQGGIVLNEVQYDPAPPGSETRFEWVELHNPGGGTIALSGWSIADGRASTALPDVEIRPGGFVVVAGEGFTELFPEYAGQLVTVGRIGNGLGNAGDSVRLLNAEGAEVDAMSYGDDTSSLDPPAPSVPAGHSLERVPAGRDTDAAADWLDMAEASPGRAASGERPTEAAATEPAPPPPPGARVVINEYLPAPRDIDWDGDGAAGSDDEWIELFNAGDSEVNLRGWRLDDMSDGGSEPYVIPDDRPLPPGGHALLFKNETGLTLNNGGDSVRLLAPDESIVDGTEFARSSPDASWARSPDGGAEWSDALPPSPGAPNGDGDPPPTAVGPGPTTSPVATPSAGASPVPTSGAPGETPSPTPSVTTTPGGGAEGPEPGLYLPFLISEVLFNPLETGNDAAYEWVELHNPGDRAAVLDGYAIGDRASWDDLPPAIVPAGGYAVVLASERAALGHRIGEAGESAGAARLIIADGRIGGGLANDGDVVRLRGPTGAVLDAVSWGDDLGAFDPAVPVGPPGASVERLPSWSDTGSASDWWIQPAPSPGFEGRRFSGAPRLVINEVLPAPSRVDWDGDGGAGHTDEFIELHNLEPFAVDVGGWVLADGLEEGWEHRLAVGLRLDPGGHAAVFRAESGIALDNGGDSVRLIRPDGVVADSFTFAEGPGYDRSWSRRPDEAGAAAAAGAGEPRWAADWMVTPGEPNRPLGPGEAHPADALGRRPRPPGRGNPDGGKGPYVGVVEADWTTARRMGRRTRVVVRGVVTAPPGTFGQREMYVGDAAGGIRVYLRPADQRLPPFRLNDPVAVIGRLSDFRGERQLALDRPGDAWWDGVAVSAPPRPVSTGEVGEALEGALVVLGGRAVAFAGGGMTLDDGSGPVRVSVRPATGIRRPWIPRGSFVRVVGIVGQSASRAPWNDGYRVMPRFADDIALGAGRLGLSGVRDGGGAGRPSRDSDAPVRLPATGGGGARSGNVGAVEATGAGGAAGRTETGRTGGAGLNGLTPRPAPHTIRQRERSTGSAR